MRDSPVGRHSWSCRPHSSEAAAVSAPASTWWTTWQRLSSGKLASSAMCWWWLEIAGWCKSWRHCRGLHHNLTVELPHEQWHYKQIIIEFKCRNIKFSRESLIKNVLQNIAENLLLEDEADVVWLAYAEYVLDVDVACCGLMTVFCLMAWGVVYTGVE